MFQRDVGGSGVEEVASVCFCGFGGGGAAAVAAEEDGGDGEEREEDGGGDDGDGYGEEFGYVGVAVVRFVVGWEDEGGDVGGESGDWSSVWRRWGWWGVRGG